jgi:hypothetical protein
MSFKDYIYEHTWHNLPSRDEITTEQRLWAAILWGELLPLVIALIMTWKTGSIVLGTVARIICISVVFQALLLIPPTGRFLYLLILRIFSLVGFIVSNTILTLFFYLVITPVGFFMHLKGRDVLRQGSGSGPFWHKRGPRKDRKRFYRMS